MEERQNLERLSTDAEEGPDVEGHGLAPPQKTEPPSMSPDEDDDVEAHVKLPPSTNI